MENSPTPWILYINRALPKPGVQLEWLPVHKQKDFLEKGALPRQEENREHLGKFCTRYILQKSKALKKWSKGVKKEEIPTVSASKHSSWQLHTLFSPLLHLSFHKPQCAAPIHLNFALPIISTFFMTRAVKFKFICIAAKLTAIRIQYKII